MEAQKVTVNIVLESLDIQTAQGQLHKLIASLDVGIETGKLVMADGDLIEWETTREHVAF